MSYSKEVSKEDRGVSKAKHYTGLTGIMMVMSDGAEYVPTENGNFRRANKSLRTKKERNRDKKLERKYRELTSTK